jgi:BlaI family transcriptional regulator, penicillinase repressor
MNTRPEIPDAELEVLKALWDQGPSSARRITELLYPKCTESDIGTVHSLLQRLEAKNLVVRDRGQRPHLFIAAKTREDIAGRQLELLARKLSDGSVAPFLVHLVDAGRLTDDELNEVRALLDQHAKRTRKRK